MRTATTAKVSNRTCVACRKIAAREELLRFVMSSSDETKASARIVFDKSKRRPGRGVWTCSTADCFEKAVERGQIARGLRVSRAAQNDEVITALRASVACYVSVD
ncbi:MAG: YlxR family protein [Coriobacteriia bacterium]|nr:YlxR family protein [Coriobacteriia bacterium]